MSRPAHAAPRAAVSPISDLHSLLSLPDDARIVVGEVAALGRFSTRQADRLVADGRLPRPSREGKARTWRVGDVKAALRALADAAQEGGRA